MRKRSYLLAGIFLAGALIINACTVTSGNEELGPTSGNDEPDLPGVLRITVTTEGPDQDRDGYDVLVGSARPLDSSPNDELLIRNLYKGDYELRLEGLDNACSVAGENPRFVSIASNDTTHTSIDVECEEVVLKNTIIYRQCDDICGLFLMNEDGTNRRRLTSNFWDSDPIISPDGTKIAFVNDHRNSEVSEPHNEIYILDASGYPVTRIPRPPESSQDWNPSWSPDGERIVFSAIHAPSTGYDIVTVNADGSDRRKITSDSSDDFMPVFSKDGDRIIFYSLNREGVSQIFQMNTDGTNITRLTDFDFFPHQLAMSNDGSRIAFSIQDDPNIYVVNSDGTGFRAVTDSEKGPYLYPTWSPDDSELMFYDFNTSDIYKVNLDGTGIVNITNTPRVTERNPFWSPVE